MEKLIANFNNISLKESFIAFFTESFLLTAIVTAFISIAVASGITAIIIYDDNLKKIIKKFILSFLIVFSVILSLTTFLLSICDGEEIVRVNRLKEIITLAQEEDLHSDLIINEDVILYKDSVCKHNMSDINDYVVINNDGKYLFIENK